MNQRSPFLTMPEAADYVRVENRKRPSKAVTDFCRKHAIPLARGPKGVLVRRADLDEALWNTTRRRAS